MFSDFCKRSCQLSTVNCQLSTESLPRASFDPLVICTAVCSFKNVREHSYQE
ncbi:MAG: hypothetical protein JGK08_05550 [Microcoleus sp. PH2017_04_SCI_O_A]|nr:hypothetical protein [Microcoleus sp. PH2017_04_SCI_O_A]